MSIQVAHRKGTTTQHSTFTGVSGEITVDTTKKTAVVHDGSTAGGNPLATSAEVAGAIEVAIGNITATDVATSDESTVQAKLDGVTTQLADIAQDVTTLQNTGVDTLVRSDKIKGNPQMPLSIATYDGSNQPMHPKVLRFDTAWNGYTYWMCYSPLPFDGDDYEHPCIAVSSDGMTWATPDGLTNPLDTYTDVGAEYLSDPCLVYNSTTGNLECWYRAVDDATWEKIYRKTSSDGITWSARELLLTADPSPTTGLLTCPVAIWDAVNAKYQLWVIYTAVGSIQRGFQYYESADATTWTEVRTFQPFGGYSRKDTLPTPWHFDIIKSDLGYELVFSARIKNTYSTLDRLWYSVSADNIQWTAPVPILERGYTGSWDAGQLYKPSIVRDTNGVLLYYSAKSAANNNQIGLIKAGSIDALRTDPRPGSLIASAVYNSNPEVVVSAADVDTDTFTSNGHGLANDDRIFPTLNQGVNGVYPLQVYAGGMAQGSYYVVNKTDNTFQISLTVGGAAIDITTNATVDLTKWHFEKYTASSLQILDLPRCSAYRAVAYHKWEKTAGNLTLLPSNANSQAWYAPYWALDTGTGFNYPMISSNNPDIFGVTEVVAEALPGGAHLKTSHNAVKTNSAQPAQIAMKHVIAEWVTNDTRIAGIPMISWALGNSQAGLANGSRLEIYSM